MNMEDISRLVFLVSGIYINLKRNVEKRLKRFNMTFSQYGVLSVAAGQVLSQKQIADALDTDTTNITVIIDSLEKKRYVRRETDPEDRRAKIIRLTEEGTAKWRRASTAVDAYRDELLQALGTHDVDPAMVLLEETYRFLKQTGDV